MNSTPQNFSSLFGSGVTLNEVMGAVLTLLLLLIIGALLRNTIRRHSGETSLRWIINEETANLVFWLFVFLGLVEFFYNLGILKYKIMGVALGNLLLAFGFFYLIYLIAKKSKDYFLGTGRVSPEVQIKAKLFYYSVLTLAFFLALNLAGLTGKLTTVLAAAGITGIVLGFSAQTVIANFISGIFMYFDKPLRLGDAVRIGDYEGIVEDIRILSTRIRLWDGTLVRIPNEKLFNSEIINLQKYPARRAELNVGIAYREDAERAIEVIRKVLEEEPYILAEPEPRVYVNELGDSSVNLKIWVWIPSDLWVGQNMMRSKYGLLRKIKEALDREGIEIPFPQRVNWFAEELRVKLEKE